MEAGMREGGAGARRVHLFKKQTRDSVAFVFVCAQSDEMQPVKRTVLSVLSGMKARN